MESMFRVIEQDGYTSTMVSLWHFSSEQSAVNSVHRLARRWRSSKSLGVALKRKKKKKGPKWLCLNPRMLPADQLWSDLKCLCCELLLNKLQ